LNRGEPAGAGGLPRDSKAQAEQVRSLDAERIGEQLGRLPDRLMASLDDALRLHLAL
jgi:mRNA interferase MazF